MHPESLLAQAFVYLAAATLSVPLAKRLGLGSVLGYLISGIILGPFVLGFVGQEHKDVMHVAEFGVVMMLFLIGLELRPAVLWRMRRQIFVLGGLQVLSCAVAIGCVVWMLFAAGWRDAVAIGMILALSSTAIALQTISEKNLMATNAGQQGFAILLLQDLAVIPMLAVLPLLALSHAAPSTGHGDVSLLAGLHPFLQTLVIIAILLGVVIGGKFLTRPVFRFIADTRLREVFTAFALALVIGIALLMHQIGLSPALGTFVAGVVLADSEYRHELESVVEPFKGLLLGIFFIAVGASIDFALVSADPLGLVAAVVALVGIKVALVYGLSRWFGARSREAAMLALTLSQGSEFAFVLLAFAAGAQVVTEPLANFFIAAVTMSMLSTPLLLIFYDVLVRKLVSVSEAESATAHGTPDRRGRVIICGYGRFGQIVGRLLYLNGVDTVLLDHSPRQIESVARFGIKVYYGDATRSDLLEAAGVEKADLVVVAIDDRAQALAIVEACKHAYPGVRVLARAHDRGHAYELMRAKADGVFRETFASAIDMGVAALTRLGVHPHQAFRLGRRFATQDQRAIEELYESYHAEDGDYVAKARQRTEDIANIIKEDQVKAAESVDHAWDGPPRVAPLG